MDIDDITVEQIGKISPTLPPEIKELLQAGERQDKTVAIGKKYELTKVEKTAILIAQDINHDIFAEVKDALSEIHLGKKMSEITVPDGLVSAPRDISFATPIPPPPPQGSILEQKLGGAFRISRPVSEENAEVSPTLSVPPPPSNAAPKITDSYREPV
ncbi:MAG: hypothetical protein UY04_C0015G0006 [Parcubacteria group bacterium GW2011_GWA2_47_7]|nr:MAG: hypothetical protein UY04_C0015G0006 [Parcubacteria group bacterium GW2011_GWA2_47_7]